MSSVYAVHFFQSEYRTIFCTFCYYHHFSTTNFRYLNIFLVVSELIRIVYTDLIISLEDRVFFEDRGIITTAPFYQFELSSLIGRYTQDRVITYGRVTNCNTQVIAYIQVVQSIVYILGIIVKEAQAVTYGLCQFQRIISQPSFFVVIIIVNYDITISQYFVRTIIQSSSCFLVPNFRISTEFIRILIYNPLSGRHVFEVHHIPFSRSNLCQVPITHQASTVLLCISTIYYIHEIDARFQNGIVSSRREAQTDTVVVCIDTCAFQLFGRTDSGFTTGTT